MMLWRRFTLEKARRKARKIADDEDPWTASHKTRRLYVDDKGRFFVEICARPVSRVPWSRFTFDGRGNLISREPLRAKECCEP